MFSLNTLLLAAGKSTRIAHCFNDLPKPLIPIDGESIIFRNLRWLNQYALSKPIFVNLHYKHALLKDRLENFARNYTNLSLNYLYEKNILGTAGAVANFSKFVRNDNPYLIIYSDNLFNFDLEKMINIHLAKQHEITVALFDQMRNQHTNIAGGYVKMNDQNHIIDFFEGHITLSTLVNAGVYLLSPQLISAIPSEQFCDFSKDLFPALLANNIPMHGHLIDGYCLGLDTLECINNANKLIKEKRVALI